MRGATAAGALWRVVHVGLVSAPVGRSFGSWPGALVAAAVALLLVRVVRHRHGGYVTDANSRREPVGPDSAR